VLGSRNLVRDRNVAWGVTWLAYASYYLGRMGFAAAKKPLHDELGISETTLGLIDTLFLGSYAAGQFLSGAIGDRIGARRLIGYGMLLSAACCAGFGAANAAVLFATLYLVNGFAQSTGWPGTTRAMAEWTTRENRGTVMSFWATCYQVGGIAASFVAGKLLQVFGWRAAFFGPALWLLAVGVLVMVVLRPGPSVASSELANPVDGATPATAETLALPSAVEATTRARKAAQWRVISNPVLWCYGASYFSIKFIRYALLFWLPYFLAQDGGMAAHTAAYVSTSFQVGGIFGVIAIGTASDRLRRFSRSLLASVALVGLALALLLYLEIGGAGLLGTIIGLALIGAMLFGPDSLISGAASQDAGGPHAAATATGFVNGLGSIGAMLEGIIVPWVSQTYGWQAIFPVFVGLALLAAACLVPTFRARAYA
jgi:sugar phosphate permease